MLRHAVEMDAFLGTLSDGSENQSMRLVNTSNKGDLA